MLTGTEVRILSAFFPEGEERATKEIEERSGYSHERVYSVLGELEKKKVLAKRMVGKALLYSVSEFSDIMYLAFAHYSICKKGKFVEKYSNAAKALEELKGKIKPEVMVVFGSYAKGDVGKKSDVDVLCIGKRKVEKTALSLRHKYNLRINPVVVAKEDFPNIRKENAEFWTDLVYFGVLVKGWELFYEMVYAME